MKKHFLKIVLKTAIFLVLTIMLNISGNYYALHERGYNTFGGEDLIWIIFVLVVFIMWIKYFSHRRIYMLSQINRQVVDSIFLK